MTMSGYSYTAGHGYVVREESAGVWLVRDRTGRAVARAKTWRKAIFWALDAPPVQDEPAGEETDDDGRDGLAAGGGVHSADSGRRGLPGVGVLPGAAGKVDDLGHVPDGDAREAADWLAGLGNRQ